MKIKDCSRVELYFVDGGMVGIDEPREIASIAEAVAESKRGTVQFVELPISGYCVNLLNVSYMKLM